MKLHIYHCSLASISDRKYSKGRSNRPARILRNPAKAGEQNVDFEPALDGFGNRKIKEFLKEFQSVDIFHLSNSPIQIEWDYVQKKLKMSKDEFEQLRRELYQKGIFRGLTIDYNYDKWMRHSKNKGCLVVMSCVEKHDYENDCLAERFCEEVLKIRNSIISENQILDTVVIVPNAHFTEPEQLGQQWDKNIEILETCRSVLREKVMKVKLTSFGYGKNFHLFIHGHKLGYVFRSI